MNKKFAKLFGVLAIFVMVGAAWAAISNGVITTDTNNVLFDTTNVDSNNGYSLGNAAATVSLSAGIGLPISTDFASYDAIGVDSRGFLTVVDIEPTATTDVAGAINVQTGQVLRLMPRATFAIGGVPSEDAYLRLFGLGRTEVYGANGNNPWVGNVRNDYAGGTYLHEGTLALASTNSLGYGNLKLRGGSTLNIFQSDVSLGNLDFENPQADLRTRQHVFIRPDTDEGAINSANVVFDVNAGLRFNIYSPLMIDATEAVTFADNLIGITKTGTGTMEINAEAGAAQTNGTIVSEGALNVLANGNKRYVSPLGFVYVANPVETQPVWNAAVIANYAAPFTNSLAIAEGASVTVNRDQVFGNFSGAGTFNTNTRDNNVNFPTVVFRADNAGTFATTLSNEPSRFTGLMNGDMDLVVETDAQDQVVYLANANNTIGRGETAVVNGVLAIEGTKTIGPGTIYVGTNNTRGTNNKFVFNNTDAAIPTFMGAGNIAIPATQLVLVNTNGATPNFAAVRGTTLAMASVDLVALPLTINHDFTGAFVPRYMSGTVSFSDQYVLRTTNRHNIDIERGVLHLQNTPVTSAANAGFMDVDIAGGAALSLGTGARDFSELMDFTIDSDDSRIRLVVLPEDVVGSQEAAEMATPIFHADIANYAALGTGLDNKDNRLVVQLDLSQVGNLLKAGSWLKIITTRDVTVGSWASLHYLRENSNGAMEDYVKVDIATVNDESFDRSKIEAVLSQNDYSILIKVSENVGPVDPDKEGLSLTASASGRTVTAVASMVKGSAPVASQDVTVTLNNVEKTAVTGTDGKATVQFTDLADGTYVVKAASGALTAETTVTVDNNNPTPDGGSSGCDAGFAGLALLLAAPLFLRKRD